MAELQDPVQKKRKNTINMDRISSKMEQNVDIILTQSLYRTDELLALNDGTYSEMPAKIEVETKWPRLGAGQGTSQYLSKMVSLLTHICVARPQWVNHLMPSLEYSELTVCKSWLPLSSPGPQLYRINGFSSIPCGKILTTRNDWMGSNLKPFEIYFLVCLKINQHAGVKSIHWST